MKPTGFHHVGQAGFELLTSGVIAGLGLQSAWITGVSHRAWPSYIIFYFASSNPYLSAEPAAILLPSGDQEHLRRFYDK